MSLIRYWSPLEEIKQLENEVSSIFRNYVDADNDFGRLRIDIEETSDEYTITADLPGVDRENIEIEATAQYLEMKINQSMDKEDKDEDRKFIVRERVRSKLARRIAFDKPVNTAEASTTLKDGVLKVVLPKLEEAKSVKLIPENN